MNSCLAYLPPVDRRYIAWLSLVAVAYNYNVWFCTARLAFPYHNPAANMYWVICDMLSDLVYLVDIVIWQPRLQFVKGGDVIVSQEAKKKKQTKTSKNKLQLKLNCNSKHVIIAAYILHYVVFMSLDVCHHPDMISHYSWSMLKRIKETNKCLLLANETRILVFS